MKSYGQLCAVARALDVVGDRWNLLIVRELLIAGRSRFSDIQRGLPGVAPNLLTQRLRALEEDGVITRGTASAPATGTLYALTERGVQLEGVVRELLKWGAPTVVDAPPDAAFQMHWLSMPARHMTRDGDPTAPPVTVRFGTLADGFDLTASGGHITVEPPRVDADLAAVVDGPGAALVGLLQGAVPLRAAASLGIAVDGDSSALERVLSSS
jgi:DNA-binding HxlR family transcriptional regulator